MDESDLIDLGRPGDKVRKVKIECPLGHPITKRFISKILNFPLRQKKESEIIILSEPIEMGKKIIKLDRTKKDHLSIKTKFFATQSEVVKIETGDDDNSFYISTKNAKYRVNFIKK